MAEQLLVSAAAAGRGQGSGTVGDGLIDLQRVGACLTGGLSLGLLGDVDAGSFAGFDWENGGNKYQ
ncbi:unnamed protein product, partial [Amoebophrya sp. A25]|eukprot:GSA25T00023159001.1